MTSRDQPAGSTRRRLQYAEGYIALGMLNEASDELEAIDFNDRFLPEVLLARIELHMEAKHWEIVIGIGKTLADTHPEVERPWIAWAYALRELNRTPEALLVLTTAEEFLVRIPALLHYNLACYYSLLGDQAGAKERLSRACKLELEFKKTALEDPDLESFWNEIGSIE
jgi:hypothetical protein